MRSIAIILLACVAVPAPATSPPPWASFGRAGALNHVAEQVQIDSDGRGGDVPHYRLHYTRTTLRESTVATADSQSCSAIRPLIGSMRSIAMPHPAPFGFDDDQRPIVLDGAGYTLTAPSTDPNGTLTITSNVGSPLAKWVDAALATLKPCWHDVSVTPAPAH